MFNPVPITLAVSAMFDDPTVGDTLSYAATGVAVVVGTLAALGIIISLLGRFFKGLAKRAEENKDDTPLVIAVPAGEQPGPHAGHEPELVALIAAAVETVITQPHRILSIEGKTGIKLHSWSAEGRRHHHSTRTSR